MNRYNEFDKTNINFNLKNKKFIKISKRKHHTIISNTHINSNKISKILEKEKGIYTTVFCEEFDGTNNILFDFLSKIIKNEIKHYLNILNLTKKENAKFFIVGLGNGQITADSLGQKVVDKIIATKKDLDSKNLSPKSFKNVFCIAPSIATKNGVYTAEIIKTLTKEFKPDTVILIDSLSCKNIKYLGKAFQINTVGLAPGCEIGNKQPKIDKKFLKTPVVSIGCPLVTNLCDIIKTKNDLVLTLKDIDIIVEKCADIISFSLNCAIQTKLKEKEIIFLTKN